MKVLSKIEGVILAIVVAIIRTCLLVIGFGFLVFDDMEIYLEAGWFMTVVFTVVCAYTEIKRCVFKCIAIVKEKK